MIEKVNPQHPDKIADRIAGAIIDYAYALAENPRIAVEVLIGHGLCAVINESSIIIDKDVIDAIVQRIAGDMNVVYVGVPQDAILTKNQHMGLRTGDNGIFKGVPVDAEVRELSMLARRIYKEVPTDGKYILDMESSRLIICQSHADESKIRGLIQDSYDTIINPLGYWVGGTDVDSGATNRKLGSDMGRAITGGGLHGKDLSKADVSVNIYAHLKAQEYGREVNICCAIGDDKIDGVCYHRVVDVAREYIISVGGFEKFAEWGLV